MKKFELRTLGSLPDAEKTLARFYDGSPAYRAFLGGKPASFAEAPICTKSNFYSHHEWEDLVPKENLDDIFAIQRSSGSSGDGTKNRGFFWPKLKSRERIVADLLGDRLANLFQLSGRRTLAIIGLSLGSWAGGEEFSFTMKLLSLTSKFPLSVFSPGNQHGEVIEIIDKYGHHFDQILIALCPSAIFYLERLAEESNTKLPREKIGFLVTGEPFPEELRFSLQEKGYGSKIDFPAMISAYGAADTGLLGFESRASVKVRQALGSQPKLAAALGFNSHSIPNLYHASVAGSFLECENNELLVTQWQGIPLVRYNLQDRVRFLSWPNLLATLAEIDPKNSSEWNAYSQLNLPDLIEVSGRTEGCVFLCGSNIFESMVQDMILQSELARVSTGTFVAWTELEGGQQVMQLQLELKPDEAAPSSAALDRIYHECVNILGRLQPEFADDYEKFYKSSEASGRQVLRFHFCDYPHLTDHPRYLNAVKRRLFIDKGPL